MVGDGDVAAVHEVDEARQVVKVDLVEVEHRVSVDLVGGRGGEYHGLEERRAGAQHQLVGADRAVPARQSDVDELSLFPSTNHRVGQLGVVVVPAERELGAILVRLSRGVMHAVIARRRVFSSLPKQITCNTLQLNRVTFYRVPQSACSKCDVTVSRFTC